MFSSTIISDAQAHALAEFPKESCGIVVGGVYLPCENVADDPENDFSIADAVVGPYLRAGTLQAVIHSHPFPVLTELSCPSARDMRGQGSTNVPWGIIDCDGKVARAPYWLGDFLLNEPLLGVEFHHGVRDCYLAIRKWYWQKRAKRLLDIPRDVKWWETDANLYVDNFERAGFERISLRELKDGDVFFGKVGGAEVRHINHAGVYLDNPEDGKGLVYHHLPGRLSRREPAGAWINRADFAARFIC